MQAAAKGTHCAWRRSAAASVAGQLACQQEWPQNQHQYHALDSPTCSALVTSCTMDWFSGSPWYVTKKLSEAMRPSVSTCFMTEEENVVRQRCSTAGRDGVVEAAGAAPAVARQGTAAQGGGCTRDRLLWSCSQRRSKARMVQAAQAAYAE